MGAASSKPETATNAQEDEKLVARLTSMALETQQRPTARVQRSALSTNGSLSQENVSEWEASVSADDKLRLSRTILSHSNLQTTLISREAAVAQPHAYNTEIDFKTSPITSQNSSGRCWLFATTNVLRYNVMKKLKMKEFELSQSYLFFWDKLNKSNYYLELSIENADLPLDDRLVQHIAGDLISDGGQWDMAVNLLEQYGMVPKQLYPESTHSSMSGPLNTLLKTKLREHALILRALHSSLTSARTLSKSQVTAALRSKKEELMKEVYTIMTATLGVPPRADAKFTYDFYDAAGTPRSWSGTPLEFYKAFVDSRAPPSDCFSLINDPRNDYGKLYTVDKLGNVWGARPVLYVNTEIGDLKSMVVKMVKSGMPVFFGSDVGKFSDRDMGLMDPALFEYENAFNIKLGLTKEQRLQMRESQMTHAMVISAVHVDEQGKPVRYKVENSWGEAPGEKGWFMMTDAWFDEFVYQVVVPKSMAPKELVKIFEGKDMTVLPPWDPMGALA